MILIPTLQIQNGHVVTLRRGRMDDPEIWHVDPVAKAREFAAAGAQWLHVTDLDAAAGSGNNNQILEDLILHANIPVQLGGGFHSHDMIETWLEKGAGRVVLGTIAAMQPDFVKAAAKRHPDQIVLSVDIWNGQVMTHGWTEPSAFDPGEFIANFAGDPLAAVVVTDIHADLGEAEDKLSLVSRLSMVAKAPVISSGIIHDLDDISRLRYMRGIDGAMVGRPLFNKRIELDAAMELAQAPAEPVPEFT